MNALLRSALPAALLSLLAPAAVAQGFFQDGDIVVSSTVWDGSSHNGRIKLYRNGQFSDILHNGVIGFARTGDIIIDQQGRVVFLATGCAGNGNNSHLIRFDPETGVAESLVCFPYFGGNIPAGLPPDALGVGIVNGLHSTRILRVVIDDDVNNGVPQVSTTEAYGFSAPIARPNNVWEKLAFRYRVEDGVIEPGVDTGLLPLFGNVGAEMATRGRETWYAFENTIGFADPTLDVQVALRTVVEGFEVSLSGNLRLAGRN
ncbi:MAG TPA: hypothetical protein VD963_01075, partial [Phycisphaerales bacterium]|nr:hypothetical protein [Phycisphaerales bacterium]